MFIYVIIIRHNDPETFQRIRLASGWVVYLCSLFGLVASGFGVYVTFTGPWTPLISYGSWVLWIGGIGVLSLIIGAVIFFVGQATFKSGVTDADVIAVRTRRDASA